MSTNNKQGTKQYGLISMIAMIIGTVVGSGIFLKNTSLIDTSHSAILVMVGWLIGGLVVLCMLLSFIEIMSITTNKGEQGTFSNWSKHLLGENFSKFVSTYFTFIYFPLIIVGETIYGAQQLFSMSETWNNNNPYLVWFLVTFITLFIIVTAMLINSLFVKPGKFVTTVGSAIKLIPLIAIILFGVIVGINLVSGLSANPVFDPTSDINNINGGGLSDSGMSQFKNIMLMLPSILFALDGFLYASSMSTETKGKHTYRNAAIISVISITLIYILFSLSTFLLGDMSDGYSKSNFGCDAILQTFFLAVTGNLAFAKSMTIVLSLIIFISIITASLNYTINTMWAVSDTSAHGILNDYNGTLIKRNKNLNPQYAGFRVIKNLFMWTFIIRFSDLGIMVLGNDVEWGSSFIMTDFITNLASTINFTFYALIIFGGMHNRITKKHKSDNLKGFFIFGIIGGVIIFGVSIYMFYGIISGIVKPYIDGGGDPLQFWASLFELVVFVGEFLAILLTAIINDRKSKNRDEKAYGYKSIYISNYENKIPHVSSIEAVRMDMFLKHKYFANKKKLTKEEIEAININEVFGVDRYISKQMKKHKINNIYDLSKLDVNIENWIYELKIKDIEKDNFKLKQNAYLDKYDVENFVDLSKLDTNKVGWIDKFEIQNIKNNTKKYISTLISEANTEIEIMKKPSN